MPRYGDLDYDPDFDDSPPPSPKRQALLKRASTGSTFQSLRRRIWRLRTTLITFAIIIGTIYLWSHGKQPVSRARHSSILNYKHVDWKLYAYSQYATDSAHLCNALMVFEALDRLGSQAQRILVYPEHMDIETSDNHGRDKELLDIARQRYKVKLMPTKIEAAPEAQPIRQSLSWTAKDQIGWDRSLSKLLAFSQTNYLRIIHLDNDVMLYEHLDDLFFLPSALIAMPRAYWLAQRPLPTPKGVLPELAVNKTEFPLSPHVMVIEPSALESTRIQAELKANPISPSETSLDVVILNKLYKDVAMVLPHRSLALRTGEFRRSIDDHQAYLGPASQRTPGGFEEVEKWDPRKALRQARMIHFAGDEPLPKPWIMWPAELFKLIQPNCGLDEEAAKAECEDWKVWKGVYDEFRKKRKDVCRVWRIEPPLWEPVEMTPSTQGVAP